MPSKRKKQLAELVEPGKRYTFDEATALLKQSKTKFKQSVDIAVMLGIDARKSDQNVRGALVLPNGTGKTQRVAVIAEGDDAKTAEQAGADLVGYEDIADDIKKGQINFDVLIATPASMRLVGQLGQILGPKGLMPNPKVGTVTTDVAAAVENAKAGQVQFRADKAGIVHCRIGDESFSDEQIKGNLEALLLELKKVKPSAAKGTYLKKVVLSTTMGPGVAIDITSVAI